VDNFLGDLSTLNPQVIHILLKGVIHNFFEHVYG